MPDRQSQIILKHRKSFRDEEKEALLNAQCSGTGVGVRKQFVPATNKKAAQKRRPYKSSKCLILKSLNPAKIPAYAPPCVYLDGATGALAIDSGVVSGYQPVQA